ncbi:unnamed protein product [Bubo scandiacus]
MFGKVIPVMKALGSTGCEGKRRLNIWDVQPCYTTAAIEAGDFSTSYHSLSFK